MFLEAAKTEVIAAVVVHYGPPDPTRRLLISLNGIAGISTTILVAHAEIDLPEDISFDLLKEHLSSHINILIQSDFQKLVSILYRVDVNESKLRHLLQENPGFDAANIITDLIIERQLQKIRSRQEYRNDENISDDEKW